MFLIPLLPSFARNLREWVKTKSWTDICGTGSISQNMRVIAVVHAVHNTITYLFLSNTIGCFSTLVQVPQRDILHNLSWIVLTTALLIYSIRARKEAPLQRAKMPTSLSLNPWFSPTADPGAKLLFLCPLPATGFSSPSQSIITWGDNPSSSVQSPRSLQVLLRTRNGKWQEASHFFPRDNHFSTSLCFGGHFISFSDLSAAILAPHPFFPPLANLIRHAESGALMFNPLKRDVLFFSLTSFLWWACNTTNSHLPKSRCNYVGLLRSKYSIILVFYTPSTHSKHSLVVPSCGKWIRFLLIMASKFRNWSLLRPWTFKENRYSRMNH
jgi:hypothetical protein